MAKTAKHYNTKKNELVDIAEKLFLEKGHEETSIEDILNASKISKGGFYHCFKSKKEVLTESINSLMETSLAELEPIIEDHEADALEKLRLFMKRKEAFQQPKKEYARFLSMVMKSDFTLHKYYLALEQKYVAPPLARIIEQGTKEGVFHVQYPLETADILLRVVTSLPQSSFFGEYMENEVKHQNYSISLREVFARVLGTEISKIWLPDDENSAKTLTKQGGGLYGK
ncbi:TetR/AcrR family transcriptional regulator [Lacrimispora sp.]|uniref:TetR/AcrR family transcriptional regulator n=1 Tax=Lacrimispora sp. TaxID=2719234 RepID=UPI0034616807